MNARLAEIERELERRKADRLALVEAELAARIEVTRKLLLADLFEEQRDLLLDESNRIAVCCSRRAGKTHTLARMVAIALMQCKRDEWVAFCAKTLDVARGIIWSELETINRVHKLGWKMHKHTGRITTAAGGEFLLCGISESKAADKLRGHKYRLVVCDEAATYDNYLSDLITPVIEPALLDLRGRLVVAGTPGRIMTGFWFDIAKNPATTAWTRKHWTLHDNPHLPDVQGYLAGILKDKGWTEEEPVFRQEYLGEWVNDTSALVYAFVRARNIASELPVPFDPATWLVTMGMDFGMTDACAWVVMGSPPGSRKIYVLHARKEWELLPEEAAEITAELVEQYRPDKIVGDASGKAYIQQWNRRHGLERHLMIRAADKNDKVGTIALFNGDMRAAGKTGAKLTDTGILFLESETVAYAYECERLPWYDGKRAKEHPDFDNHCTDAGLYCWRAHRAYDAKPPTPPQSDDELARKRHELAQAERMARAKVANGRGRIKMAA